MLTVMVVMGTRPEIIKLAPVVHRLRESPETKVRVVLSGQHRELLVGLLELFDLRPEIDLSVMMQDQSVSKTAAAVLSRMDDIFREAKPDLLLVQGDTTTAFAASASAFFHKVPVGHVEAGLRTNDRFNPFPEELNRRWISVAADYHFAPTEHSRQNLLHEGHPASSIHLTGNTVIDALMFAVERLQSGTKPSTPAPQGKPFILVTVHRRENQGEPMKRICDAIQSIVTLHPEFEVVLPVHANPNVSRTVREKLGQNPRIRLVEPLDYLSFVDHMRSCYLILSDSGGVQEEGPAFQKPILVMRLTTERPEGIEAGTSELVGCEPDDIVRRVSQLIVDKQEYQSFAQAVNPFGDGLAATRIASILGRRFSIPSLGRDVPEFHVEASSMTKGAD